jgi:NADPH:quinone reductase-like Zn-dependent oxidoreductase
MRPISGLRLLYITPFDLGIAMTSYRDKTVLVTGASSGIGLALATPWLVEAHM